VYKTPEVQAVSVNVPTRGPVRVPSCERRHQLQDQLATPIEPILFPRLRMYNVDSPHLFAFHSIDCNSWIPVAVMCTPYASLLTIKMFQGTGRQHQPLQSVVVLVRVRAIAGWTISNPHRHLDEKENFSWAPPCRSLNSTMLPYYHCIIARILTCFPFSVCQRTINC